MSAAAARQRLHRQRESAGKIVLRIEAPEVDLIEALALTGFLRRELADDRAELERALGRVVELWCSRHA